MTLPTTVIPQPAEDWQPTPEHINALPAPIRRYIAELETLCDPAGIVRENVMLRDALAALEKMREEAQPAAVLEQDALIDLINERIGGAYFCTRVWAAWGVGTMSEDDFMLVEESDTPAELADALIAMLAAAPMPPSQDAKDAERWRLHVKLYAEKMGVPEEDVITEIDVTMSAIKAKNRTRSIES